MSNKRGLVVSPPIEITDGSMFVKSSHLDPQELRRNLLFWDVLDYPSHMMNFGGGPDVDFLIDAGVIQRTRSPIMMVNFPDIIVDGQIRVFLMLNEYSPGMWSLSSG